MTKILRCNDLMPGCSFEARGNSEEEVLAQAAEHAKTVHNLTEIPEGMLSQVRGAIHDDEPTGTHAAGA
jgi:predicted small metal-binding protein